MQSGWLKQTIDQASRQCRIVDEAHSLTEAEQIAVSAAGGIRGLLARWQEVKP